MRAAQQTEVEVQYPYNESAVAEVTKYMSNTTNVTLDEVVYSGRLRR